MPLLNPSILSYFFLLALLFPVTTGGAPFSHNRKPTMVHAAFLASPGRRVAVRFSSQPSKMSSLASPTTGEELLDPSTLGEIPYPTSLSPSAVMEFKQCPQSYLFQYLYNIRQPPNQALAKGSMCHEALEKIFDLDPNDRSLERLQNLFRSSWQQHRLDAKYKDLFHISTKHYNVSEEREWGQSALKLLENYHQVEDPRLVQRPNPIQREIWVRADLRVDFKLGVTASRNHHRDVPEETTTNASNSTFHVRGIVDRLDMVKMPNSSQVVLRIVDYKTGKAPNFKYSQAMNEKIATEAFYQLKIYALLLRESNSLYINGSMDLRMLRLLFLTSESGRGEYLDYDLGETQDQRDAVLQEIHQDLSSVWTSIQELVATQDPKAFVGCNRSFCYCHKCRTQFVPGTVWEESL
jgi:putative RecB family exonuclease